MLKIYGEGAQNRSILVDLSKFFFQLTRRNFKMMGHADPSITLGIYTHWATNEKTNSQKVLTGGSYKRKRIQIYRRNKKSNMSSNMSVKFARLGYIENFNRIR